MSDTLQVISWVNARKKWYGENHWFWAVWIDVRRGEDRRHDWDGSEPAAKGFCHSEHEARRLAWIKVKEHVDPARWRAAKRSWAYDYLRKLEEQDKRPYFSRCRVGKKWFWVVFTDSIALWEKDEHLAQGYADTPEAAEQAATEAVEPVQLVEVRPAQECLKKKACIRRSQRKSEASDAAAIEYVYQCYGSYDQREDVESFRIFKKTKKMVFVVEDNREKRLTGDWYDYRQRTFTLDREKLEKEGSVWSRTMGGRFYANPETYFAEHRSESFLPKCFVKLGLGAGATEDDIKTAYRRLARTTHPDAGGDADEFKSLVGYYEEAMRIITVDATVA